MWKDIFVTILTFLFMATVYGLIFGLGLIADRYVEPYLRQSIARRTRPDCGDRP